MTKLPKALQKGPFTYQQALDAGLTFSTLRRLVASEQCYSVSRGVYMPINIDYNEENQFKVATLITGEPSVICLLSALSVYGLTDQIPRQTWVTVPKSKRTREKSLKILRQVDPQWNIGIHKKNGYSITSIERTIVEAFFYKRMLGSNVAISALREAVKAKITTPSKVLDMSKKLGVVRSILPYLEAMA